MTTTQPLTVAIAGSTNHTLQVVKTLANTSRFQISWVLTPKPKKVGRQQKLQTNPIHNWAQQNHISTILVDKKIDAIIQQKVKQVNSKTNKVDLLLVIDFGYIIPKWLLRWPSINTVNLHPSLLPRWRGSSPGQFVILNQEKKSAITLMELEEKLDTGAIIKQLPFTVKENWASQDYYQFSFKLASQHLPQWLWQYAQKKIQPQPQPDQSPTRIARRLSKDDAYLPWEIIKAAQSGLNKLPPPITKLDWPKKSVLKDKILQQSASSWPQLIKQASLAFQPWPVLWTKIQTKKGKRRMQILACQIQNKPQPHLILDQVKIAGQKQAQWNQVKNILK